MDLRFGIIYVKRVILGKRLAKEEKTAQKCQKEKRQQLKAFQILTGSQILAVMQFMAIQKYIWEMVPFGKPSTWWRRHGLVHTGPLMPPQVLQMRHRSRMDTGAHSGLL